MTFGAVDDELVTAADMGAGGAPHHVFVITDETVAALVVKLQRTPAGHDTFTPIKRVDGDQWRGGGARRLLPPPHWTQLRAARGQDPVRGASPARRGGGVGRPTRPMVLHQAATSFLGHFVSC